MVMSFTVKFDGFKIITYNIDSLKHIDDHDVRNDLLNVYKTRGIEPPKWLTEKTLTDYDKTWYIPKGIYRIADHMFYTYVDSIQLFYRLVYKTRFLIENFTVKLPCININWLGKYGLACCNHLIDSNIIIYNACTSTITKFYIAECEGEEGVIVSFLTPIIFLLKLCHSKRLLFVNGDRIIKNIAIDDKQMDSEYHPLFDNYFVNISNRGYNIYKVDATISSISLYQRIEDPNYKDYDEYSMRYNDKGFLEIETDYSYEYSLDLHPDGKFFLRDSMGWVPTRTLCNFEDIRFELLNLLPKVQLLIVFVPIIYEYLNAEICPYRSIKLCFVD